MAKETSGVTRKRFLEILRASAKKKDPVELELTKGGAKVAGVISAVFEDSVLVEGPPISIDEIASVLVRQAPPPKRVVDLEKLQRLVIKSKKRGRGSSGSPGGGGRTG
jgi:hypothetical protein